ncbi:hypothetical protein JG688_00010597 [Phytophthora aleatoria]|uniref:Elicitin n=1 Tax=Phytophthora aleatoria TaxID=2496075 RepID=A0A8J5J1T1_9STRA|nr:hypothetical protein JG688_00010597 [Phytophthora aleatoria]
MTSIQTLLKVVAFCALNARLLSAARAQVVLALPEDHSCRTTLEMAHDGLMAVTDPDCLVTDDEPGCNLFGRPDCRVCALMPEIVADEVPLCELLDIFNQENGPFGEESVDFDFYEPQIPPPLVPVGPIGPPEPVEPVESSDEEDYVPTVIVLPTDVFIESSVWDDSEASTDDAEDSDAGVEQNDPTRHLRAQL